MSEELKKEAVKEVRENGVSVAYVSDFVEKWIDKASQSATLAERKRCAQIARNLEVDCPSCEGKKCGICWESGKVRPSGEVIAQAIEKGDTL